MSANHDYSSHTDTQLRAMQDHAAMRVQDLCDQASAVSYEMSNTPAFNTAHYKALHAKWTRLIAEANEFASTIPAITVEIERRAQERLANA